tara:strand:+ start:265 stop:642 length:378 start_codon:yes stop_codon:yes gene_type:complete
MRIEVSLGEVLDKVSILQIKMEKISDKNRLKHVRHELNILEHLMNEHEVVIPRDLFDELKSINLKLWETEDIIRECEKNNDFGSEFVQHARLDAKLNDKRFLIKNQINTRMNSNIKEQKSYEGLY